MNTSNEYLKLINQADRVLDDLNALKLRFHAFVHTNDISGMLEMSLYGSGGHAMPTCYSFSIEASSNDGAMFYAQVFDYDATEEVYFCIPSEYMIDPDAWEARMLQEIEKDVILGQAVLVSTFSESASVLFPHVTISRPGIARDSKEEAARYLVITIDPKILKMVTPQTKNERDFFSENNQRLTYDRETGIVFAQRYHFYHRPTNDEMFHVFK